jgi:hypothetical protein
MKFLTRWVVAWAIGRVRTSNYFVWDINLKENQIDIGLLEKDDDEQLFDPNQYHNGRLTLGDDMRPLHAEVETDDLVTSGQWENFMQETVTSKFVKDKNDSVLDNDGLVVFIAIAAVGAFAIWWFMG